MSFLGGYHGKILRVDLTSKSFREEELSAELARKFVGERASASSACSTKSILSPMRFRRRTSWFLPQARLRVPTLLVPAACRSRPNDWAAT